MHIAIFSICVRACHCSPQRGEFVCSAWCGSGVAVPRRSAFCTSLNKGDLSHATARPRAALLDPLRTRQQRRVTTSRPRARYPPASGQLIDRAPSALQNIQQHRRRLLRLQWRPTWIDHHTMARPPSCGSSHKDSKTGYHARAQTFGQPSSMALQQSKERQWSYHRLMQDGSKQIWWSRGTALHTIHASRPRATSQITIQPVTQT